MAWTDLTLPGKLLDGIDTTAFGFLRDATLTVDEATDEASRFESARNKLRLLMMNRKYLGVFAASHGLDTFFDDLADNSNLTNDLAQALAHTYAWLRYEHDSQSPGDIDSERAITQRRCVIEILEALSTTVPVELGVTSEAPGAPGFSAYATAMDSSGRTSFQDSDGNAL